MPAPRGAVPALFHLYRGVTSVLAPFAYWAVSRKLRAQGVASLRAHERLGNASLPRPSRPVIWLHAASVGESLSVLTLITRMGERLPGHDFLITSGTATSAKLIAKRLPPRSAHQFAPLDATGPVRRFLDHWRPEAAILVESEIWPIMLADTHAPMALVNARLSDRSVAAWRKRPRSAAFLMDQFRILLAQNQRSADNLRAMGAASDRVMLCGNLKATSDPLPVDHAALHQFQTELGARLHWVASSTHPGEEEIVLDAHKALLELRPDLCLVLIPRHPERGDEIAERAADAGLGLARRSASQPITDDTQIYLADTLGETGTWYASSPFTFLGGSLLRDIGGHNPIEPAQANAAIISGPHVSNFSETYAPLVESGGAVLVHTAQDLAAQVEEWFRDDQALHRARHGARSYVADQSGALEQIVDQLVSALDLGA